MRLSLAMIVKNEEANLARCLQSVEGLVNEMVVLDTGSTDGTVDLALSLGARVEHFPWVNDFSKARNAAISLCRGDWILVLDADETIDAMDHGKIHAAMTHKEMQGWYLWLRDYFRSGAFIGLSGAVKPNASDYTEGREYSHQTSYELVRLFRRQPLPVFQGRIHEVAEIYFQERNLPLGHLDAVIHHFGKIDPEKDLAKQKEYTRLAKLEAQTDPSDPIKHFNVVQQGLLVDDWKAVLSSAEAFLKLEPKVPLMIYLGAVKALMGLKRPGEAVRYVDAMLKEQPRNAVVLELQGEVMEKLDKTEDAQGSYLRAIESEPGFTLSFLRLARILEKDGQSEQARKVLEAGLDQNPLDEVLWSELVAQAGKHWPEQAIRDAWDAINELPDGGKGLWHKLVINGLVAQEARTEAMEVVRRGLKVFPEDPELLEWGKKLSESVKA